VVDKGYFSLKCSQKEPVFDENLAFLVSNVTHLRVEGKSGTTLE
jgi:hypothetical protein